jgi:hypothetical protein
LKAFVCRRLGLSAYLEAPGDGRVQPQIPAAALLWSLLVGFVLREVSFQAVEALVRSSARQALGVARSFGNDALAYFTERLSPEPTRQALTEVLRRAKRNKAFRQSWWIGLAVDGTGAGTSCERSCALCHPTFNAQQEVVGHHHRLSLISVVGTGLSLPFDVEPYGRGDSEYAASQRLLQRAVERLGRRFADYVVADGEYATAPFLHLAGELGLRVVARLKANLPTLLQQAQQRFEAQPPTSTFQENRDRIEVWDAEDFDPWDTLRWQSVRVLRYRQHRCDGRVIEAYWLTDFPRHLISPRQLYHMAKSRWEIENQGFNDAKNRYGMAHTPHHHPNSLLIHWLLLVFALTLERLYRLRYLHRGGRPPYTAIEFLRLLRLSLGRPAAPDTS